MNEDILPHLVVLPEANVVQNENLRHDVSVGDNNMGSEFSSLDIPASEHPTPSVNRHLCESRLNQMILQMSNSDILSQMMPINVITPGSPDAQILRGRLNESSGNVIIPNCL